MRASERMRMLQAADARRVWPRRLVAAASVVAHAAYLLTAGGLLWSLWSGPGYETFGDPAGWYGALLVLLAFPLLLLLAAGVRPGPVVSALLPPLCICLVAWSDVRAATIPMTLWLVVHLAVLGRCSVRWCAEVRAGGATP